jgi:hypothetical protein
MNDGLERIWNENAVIVHRSIHKRFLLNLFQFIVGVWKSEQSLKGSNLCALKFKILYIDASYNGTASEYQLLGR